MNADIMTEWLRRQELRVARSASSYWVEAGPRIYQAFPYHWVIQPDEVELAELLRSQGGIGARYSTPLAAPVGKVSYHVVFSGKEYSLDLLAKKARYDVRKGLGCLRVEPISLQQQASAGWDLRMETLLRQGRSKAESKSWWERLCLSAEGLPGFECWGAIDTRSGTLVSSLLACTVDDCCSIFYQQSRTEYLHLGANNALTYVFTSEVLKRPGILEIFYGLHSLDAPPTIDDYKFRMGFHARPVRQRVVFRPWLSPLISQPGYRAVKTLLKLKPDTPLLAKAEGMLRFYLEGKRPLAEQEWPAALSDRKGCLLAATSSAGP